MAGVDLGVGTPLTLLSDHRQPRKGGLDALASIRDTSE
jgi:hypothetical protein